ncbi:hypothetical protein D3C78_1360050 [compost metagenome]
MHPFTNARHHFWIAPMISATPRSMDITRVNDHTDTRINPVLSNIIKAYKFNVERQACE